MIHPHTELRFISPEIGFGVIATQLIPKGTITWVFDPLDHVFTPDQIRSMPPLFKEKLHTYTYRDHNGNFVLCWDHARFFNHSCAPNCESEVEKGHIYLDAIRAIAPGEELTYDYALTRDSADDEAEEARFPCRCGAPWPGLVAAEQALTDEARQRGLPLEAVRRERQALYGKWLLEEPDGERDARDSPVERSAQKRG